jgi:beta-lactamase regulating signal transducer with metallopeptidase domain
MTYLPEAVCWTLLHFLWQATVIALLYKCADRCLSGDSVRTRYSLALAALLAMIGVSIGTAAYEVARLGQFQWISVSGPMFSLADAATPAVNDFRWDGPLAHIRPERFTPWLDGAWLLGVLLMSARATGGAWLLAHRTSRSCTAPPEVVHRLANLVRRMNVKTTVGVRLHTALSGPFVAGAFRPVIYLPFSILGGLDAEQLEAILVHELAHVIRADYALNILQIITETLFFFHPAVWWLGGVLREQRELCCDDTVLGSSTAPKTYAAALLVVAQNGRSTFPLAMNVAGHDSKMQLLPRITRILGGAFHSRLELRSSLLLRLSVPAIAGLALLCGTSALPVGRLSPESTASSVVPALAPGQAIVKNFEACKHEPDVDTACLAIAAEETARSQAPALARERAAKVTSRIETDGHLRASIAHVTPPVIRVPGPDVNVDALALAAARAAVDDRRVQALCERIWDSLTVKPSGPRCAAGTPPSATTGVVTSP